MLDIKQLTIDELRELKREIEEEIRVRQEAEAKKVVYTHDCKDKASYHKGKYKHWAKLVTSVDSSKTDGYAFVGEFLKIDSEHYVPAGAIVVEVCSDTFTAYKVIGDYKKELISEGKRNSLVPFIRVVEESLGK